MLPFNKHKQVLSLGNIIKLKTNYALIRKCSLLILLNTIYNPILSCKKKKKNPSGQKHSEPCQTQIWSIFAKIVFRISKRKVHKLSWATAFWVYKNSVKLFLYIKTLRTTTFQFFHYINILWTTAFLNKFWFEWLFLLLY